jgi:hypothetical protein
VKIWDESKGRRSIDDEGNTNGENTKQRLNEMELGSSSFS